MANTSKRNAKSKSSASTSSSKSSRGRTSVPFYSDLIGLAGSLLHSTQESGAEKISTFADATRNFASDFENIPNIQTYVSSAADQMENLAGYVSETSLEEMVADAGEFAKRYPIATAAFAVAAGFSFVRIVRSSNTPTTTHRSRRRSNKPQPSAQSTRRRATSVSKHKANGRGHAETSANAA